MRKFCIAGKNNIAVSILEYLLFEKKVAKNDVVICCNRNDNGKNGWQRSLRFAAEKLSVKEVSLEEAQDIDNLVFLSLEFDRLVKPSLFKSKELFNIHFSLLPKYKGMYTAALPILNNENTTGVTFHRIDSGIDTGAIIAQRKIPIGFGDTARDVYLKNIRYGTELVKESIDVYFADGFNFRAVEQPSDDSSYYSSRSIDYSNVKIDLRQTALSIHNQIRAFNFREYQVPVIGGHKVRFSEITANRSVEKTGTVVWESDDRLLLATIDYDIVLYFDRFDEIIDACKNNDADLLRKIAGLHHYVNEQDCHGWTPLMVATYNGFYDMTMFLVVNGANIYAVNNNGTNLLMYAKDAYVQTGDSKLFEFYYRRGISPDAVDYNYKSLRHYCVEQELENVLKHIARDKMDLEAMRGQ